MSKKTICYDDPAKDDFAKNGLDKTHIPADFPFAETDVFHRISEFLLYRVVATPIVFLISKLGFGLRVKNRRALRGLGGTGFYLYGNHTQGMMDAYIPTLAVFPRHAHIVVGSQAVSNPALRFLVCRLGGIPTPSTICGMRSFANALSLRIKEKRVVTVYPEAHIWPWYTGIRPFPDTSFTYPVKDGVPAVAFVTTYRRRRIFSNLPPCLTVTLSEPFYPDASLEAPEARKKLCGNVYDFMCREAARCDNYAYYSYIKKE